MLNRITPLALLITITSCGGGGGSGTIAKGNIPADFDLFKATGTWRLTANVNSTLLDTSGILDSLSLTGETTVATVSSIKTNGNDITFSDCDALAPETIKASELESRIKDESDDDEIFCDSETIEYTKLSNDNYLITYSCDDTFDVTTEYTRIDDTGDLNFGNLAFSYDAFGDLNTTTGVCGTINSEHLITVATPQPNALDLEDSDETFQSFTIVAPYNGERIEMDFTFTRNITIASYNATSDAELDNDVEVTIELESTQFLDFAETGSVNITAISQFSITGNFNFVTADENNMSGNFSFDIE